MKNGRVQNLKEAKEWFADKANNKDGIGVIAEKKDGSTIRLGNAKEADKFYSTK